MNWFVKNCQQIIAITVISMLVGCEKKSDKLPVVSTTPLSDITSTTAESGGNITEEGSSTITSRGVCWSINNNPTIEDNRTKDGAGAGGFSSSITNLVGGTTYFIRAYATNSSGTGYGMALSFTTLGQSPLPIITSPTPISATEVRLNGSVNPNYLSTTVTFEYGTSTGYGSTATANQSPLTGSTETSVSATITGLTAGGTTYHVRIKAVNSLGTTYSNDITFTTLGEAPSVSTLPATNPSVSSAQLNGYVNANYLPTTVTFEYGTTTNYGNTISASPSSVTGSINVNANISGLEAATVYHYRVKAVNSLGTTFGNDLTFTTLGQPPTAITQLATNLQPFSSTLNGTINANHFSTVVTFEYGTTTSYGNTVTANQSPVTGSSDTNVNAPITGLQGGTAYHYRIVATNYLGTSYGSDVLFMTLGQVPTATTQIATNVFTTTATLNGIINANYLSTTVTFEYGTTTSYGNAVTATPNPVTGNTNTTVNANITSLSSNTLYNFRVKTENSLGITYGDNMTFTTDPTSITDYDGNTYQVLRIGTQIWMTENLKVTHYRDGSNIPYVTNPDTWKTLTYAAYCWHDNDEATYKNTYGALYNWFCVADNRKICPTGWHIPSDAEWSTLSTFLGGESIAGGKMKTTGTLEQGNGLWVTPNTSADNSSGFSGLPSDMRDPNGVFYNIGYNAYFWSSTEYGSLDAWARDLIYDDSRLHRGNGSKRWGWSIRCIKD